MFNRLQSITDRIIYDVALLSPASHRSQALNFFIYDGIKILLLLIVITTLMTLLNSYLPIEKIKNFLHKNKLFWLEYFFASLFGAITPFCTCSSIPLFVGFLKAGIPLGVTFSFLITSPLVNEVAIAMFLGIFGIKVTAIYMGTGMLLGIIGGWILGKLWLEKYLADFIQAKRANQETNINKTHIPFNQRIKEVFNEASNITIKIIPYVLLWVAVGGAIHGFVPTWFFEQYITKSNPFAVPLAVIFWVPMYANATSVIPIVQALIAKWIPLGTGLAFMMAVVGLSLPEFLILKKIMKMRLLLTFFWVVALSIIIAWYIFNWIL